MHCEYLKIVQVSRCIGCRWGTGSSFSFLLTSDMFRMEPRNRARKVLGTNHCIWDYRLGG